MIDLILSIIFFALIPVFFKLFEKYKVNNLQAIVANYLVAGSCGLIFSDVQIKVNELVELPWLGFAITIGIFFILVFNLLAKATQKVGIAIATVANKMSLILPVLASFMLFDDDINFYKIIGICFALLGVFFSATSKGKINFDIKYLWLILVIFFGQGFADILFNYAQNNYVEQAHGALFISILFLSAFVCGTFYLVFNALRKGLNFEFKNLIWGFALGIPNFLTVYYFFNALESQTVQSSQAYPILNMGIVILTALIGWIGFKESLTLRNWFGIILAVIAIAAIGFN